MHLTTTTTDRYYNANIEMTMDNRALFSASHLHRNSPYAGASVPTLLQLHQAIIGDRVALGCNSSHWSDQSVSLVLWYKGLSDVPFYTLDARSEEHTSLHRASHIISPASDLKDRVRMDIKNLPPKLIIENVTKSDQGLFRCRVSTYINITHFSPLPSLSLQFDQTQPKYPCSLCICRCDFAID